MRVAKPPPKPLMVYDGECNFCKYWANRWRQMTGETVAYTPLQNRQLEIDFPEIPQREFENAVHFIESDGAVYSGAEAVFVSLAKCPRRRWLLRFYRQSHLLAGLSEISYHFISRHRSFFSWIWGTHP